MKHRHIARAVLALLVATALPAQERSVEVPKTGTAMVDFPMGR